MGRDYKDVPRWALGEGVEKVVQYQRQNVDPEEIFGVLKPKHAIEKFADNQIFSKGSDMRSYLDFDEDRGSSADWHDQSDRFGTPSPTNYARTLNIPGPEQTASAATD